MHHWHTFRKNRSSFIPVPRDDTVREEYSVQSKALWNWNASPLSLKEKYTEGNDLIDYFHFSSGTSKHFVICTISIIVWLHGKSNDSVPITESIQKGIW
jgi:hypothetical protein